MRDLRFLLVSAALGAACGDEHTHADAGATCDDDPRAMTFAGGMSVTGGRFTVTVEDAVPAPPARFDNAWTVAVAPAFDDLTVVVTPFMPDHGHGAHEAPVVTPLGDGRYDVAPLDLWMPGIWEIRFTLTDAGGPEVVTFSFCIAQ